MALDFSLKGTSFEKKEEPSPSTLDFSLKGTSFYKEPAVEEESTSGVEAGLTGFVKELIPSTGAFAVGTRAGMAAAAATPPVLPVVGPLAKPVVGGAVGLVAGLLAAFGLSEGQEAVLEKVAPETLARAKRAEKEHPYAYHAGSLASVAPASGVGVKALKELADIEIKKGTKLGMGKATAGFAGLGAGFETGMELATTGEVDPVKVAMSAAAFPVTLGNTKFGGKLAGIKEPTPTPTPEPTPEALPGKSSVDTTLEQWQNELKVEQSSTEGVDIKDSTPAVEQAKSESIRPQEQPITPPEGVKPTEGIPAPQGDVETRIKELEKEKEVNVPMSKKFDSDTPGKTPLARIVKPSTKQQQDIQLVQENLTPDAKSTLELQLGRSLTTKDYQDLVSALYKRADGSITEDAVFRQLFGDNLDYVQKELSPIKETDAESVLFKSSEELTPEELQGVGQEEQLVNGEIYVKSRSGSPLLLDSAYPEAIAQRIATENARNPDLDFEAVSARQEGFDSDKVLIKGRPKVEKETTEFTFQDLQRLAGEQDVVRTSTDRGVGADPQGGWVYFKQGDKLFKKRVGRAEDGIVHFEMENGQVFSVPAYKLAYAMRGKEQRSSAKVTNVEGQKVISEASTPKHQTVLSALSSILTHGGVKSAFVLNKKGKKVDVLSSEGLSELQIGTKSFKQLEKEYKDALKLTEEQIDKADLTKALLRVSPLQIKNRRELLEARLKKAKEDGNTKAEIAAYKAISTIKEDLARVIVQEDRLKKQIETEWSAPEIKTELEKETTGGSPTERFRLKEAADRAPTASKPIVSKVTRGIIKEADGTPALTDAGTSRIARRNKDSGEIELNPDAAVEPKVIQEGKIPSIYDVVDEADFHAKGKQVLKEQGPEAARKFAEDYQNYRKENYVNIPKTDPSNPMNEHPMADALYNLDTLHRKDEAELRLLVQENPEGLLAKGMQGVVGGERPRTLAEQGITKEVKERWSKALDGELKLSPEEQALLDRIIEPMRVEAEALARKTGEPLVEGYQPRIRLWTPKSLKETFGKWWEDMTRTEGAFAQKMAETPDALKERNMYVLERPNGNRSVIQIRKDGIYQYKNGKMSVLVKGSTDAKKVGDTLGTDGVIKEAKISEIETHTPYRYSKDPVLNWKIRLNELRKLDREQTFLRELTSHPNFKDMGVDVLSKETGKPNELPEGWKVPKHIDRIPQLAGKAFEPKIAYILEDWAKGWNKSMMQNLTSFLIKNMMLNPLPHVFNEAMHLYNIRGATGWFTPGGIYRFSTTASQGMRDVFNQSPLYLQVMKEGGSLLGADPRNKQFVRDVLDKAAKDAFDDPNFKKDLSTIAFKVGMKPLDLYNRWSQASNKFMWVTRDMMYMQVIRETMKRKGVDVKGAIKIVEKHMPNYRLPSKIMGSRAVSEVLGNPNVAVFSRYHYGMVRSILETLKEANPKNLKTPEGKQKFLHAADVMAAVGIAFAGLYPVMDKLATEMFGMEAEQRRAGPYHLAHALKEVKEGKKDVQTALAPVFTFNPVLLYGGQLVMNRQLYSGKEVYHPNDSAEMILSDVGNYTLKTIPQYGPMQQAEESPEGMSKFIAKQMDIKAKTRDELRKQRVRAKHVESARKRREKLYLKGD